MKYCTNCGQETIKRICTNCGVKQNTINSFCGWCGEPLNKNASVCPKCNTRIKQSVLSKIYMIIGIILFVLSLFLLIAGAGMREKICAICILISAMFLMPFVGNIIYIVSNKKKRIIFSILRIAIVLILACGVPNWTEPTSSLLESPSIKERACTEAVEVFHQNVRLKNEKSFQLNGYSVMTDENYQSKENLTRYIITVKYSAQNGFGGNSNDEYKVALLYNSEDDKFTVLSAGE